MKRKILLGILAVLVALAAYFVFSFSKEPKELTTNIDIKNKIITESALEDPTENDASFASLLNSIAQSLSASISDNVSLLAAAVNSDVKIVKITPGMRKEEIATVLQNKLAWSAGEKDKFLNVNKLVNTSNAEGYYYPDSYIIPLEADGYEVGKLMINRFNDKVMSRYASSTAKIVNVDTAMKVASIIEREAAGKNDMRLISGIMWNRIFKDMTLDMDATLQYVKGSEEGGWWPKVVSEDKFLISPYNTYKNKGLTPTPISNPQLVSIEAALNPKKTSCLFYLHDKYRRIHCSATYKEHVRNIERYYGR